jgi:hypothetical protein
MRKATRLALTFRQQEWPSRRIDPLLTGFSRVMDVARRAAYSVGTQSFRQFLQPAGDNLYPVIARKMVHEQSFAGG